MSDNTKVVLEILRGTIVSYHIEYLACFCTLLHLGRTSSDLMWHADLG